MFLIFALAILAFSALFLWKFLGPEFWTYDPFSPDGDIWETDGD